MAENNNVRYVLSPGYVTSKTDGDRHYIGAAKLRQLYGVPATARCVSDESPGYQPMPGDAVLCPLYSGDYQRVQS